MRLYKHNSIQIENKGGANALLSSHNSDDNDEMTESFDSPLGKQVAVTRQ